MAYGVHSDWPFDAISGAHGAVARALRLGTLPRSGVCEACGRACDTTPAGGSMKLHHWSYAREHWTDVILLDASCHRLVHNGRIPEPRTGRIYPGRDGVPAERSIANLRAFVIDLCGTGPHPRERMPYQDYEGHIRHAKAAGLLVGTGNRVSRSRWSPGPAFVVGA